MEIRAVDFGENLNEWFRVLGRNWKPLLISSLIAFAPVSVAVAGLFTLTGAGEMFTNLMDPEYLANIPESDIWDEMTSFMWVGLAWALLQTLATLFVYLAGSRTVAVDRAGLTPTWRSVSVHALGRFVPALLAGLLLAIVFVFGTAVAVAIGWFMVTNLGADFLSVFVTTVAALTLIVVFVWLGVSVAVYPQVLAMEETGAASALQRSVALVRGRWWPTFGFVLLTSLIASLAAQVVGIAFVPLSFVGVAVPAILGVIYGLAVLAQGPVTAAMAAAYAVWYVDLRARKEQLVAEQLV